MPPLNIVERVSVAERTGPRVIVFWDSDTEDRPGCADDMKRAAECHHAKKGNGAQQGQACKWEREWEQHKAVHGHVRGIAPVLSLLR
jgi:hypothetical protein